MVIWPLVAVGYAMVFFNAQPPSTFVKVCKYQNPSNQFATETHWVWPEQHCPPGIKR